MTDGARHGLKAVMIRLPLATAAISVTRLVYRTMSAQSFDPEIKALFQDNSARCRVGPGQPIVARDCVVPDDLRPLAA